MHKIREQHAILQQYTYLNTANHGLMSQDLIDYRVQELAKMRDLASGYTNNRGVFIDQVRETVAHFLDATVHNTALIPNFSTGFNTLVDGIPSDAKILLLEGDYPSVNWPFETRGFNCVYAKIDSDLENQILDTCATQQPDFFCFSMVQYISGIKMDLDFLKQLKKQYPNMVIISDFTQYVGCEEFRFRESGIDIILASCYKWLNAGDGSAFMCIKEDVKNRILPQRFPRKTKAVMPPESTFIERFEPGHLDMITMGSLQFAIKRAQEIGLDNIENSLQKWSQTAKKEFEERGLLHPSVVGRSHHSTIFNIKGDQQLFNQLNDRKIITSLRGDGIRVSFSYYNNQDDLNALLEVVDLCNE